MNKNQELLLEMIYRVAGIETLDLSVGDSKYLLSNMIAKYTNSDKIYLSKKTKDLLESKNIGIFGDVKYQSQFYGKRCSFYKKNKIQFVVDHVIPCNVMLSHILSSDKEKETIKKILDNNRVVMLLKEEDDLLHKLGFGKKTCEEFHIETNIWGRYEKASIEVTENYFVNVGSIFR
jgi:hypothetical protein